MTTLNKNLTTPANNSSNWDVPLNSNFNILDIAFGGVQAFNLAAFAGGTIAVSSGTYVGSYPTNTASYLPLTFSITGTPTGNTTLQIPSTVGGAWIIRNSIPAATAFTLTISSGGGGTSVVVPNNTTRTVFSDGTNIAFSDGQSTVAGSTTQVIYNIGGALTGSANLTFDGTTLTANALAVSTNAAISGAATVTGAVTSGGIIKSTSGGFTFPDNTTQTTASVKSLIRAPQILTSGTTYTAPANCTSIYVELVGGGGSGGGCNNSQYVAGGGGAGGYGAALLTVTGGGSYTYAIGAGGTALTGSSNATGNSGGNTTFTVGANTLTGNGGAGGSGGSAYTGYGGAGGTGSITSGSALISIGGDGTSALYVNGGSYMGGTGGSSYFGGGGTGCTGGGGSGGATDGSAGKAYGSGGGAGKAGGTSGAGKQGIILIHEYT